MTTLSPVPPGAQSGAHRIRGPAELLQAVPYLLGFHPASSLVLVGMHHDSLIVTARVDLADLAVPGLLRDTVAALARGGSTSIVAVVYDSDEISQRVSAGDTDWGDPGEMWGELAATLDVVADGVGCSLLDLYVVTRGRWWSALCAGNECCPPSGTLLSAQPSAFAAAATVAGVVPLPDRAAVESLLDPAPEAEIVAAELVEEAENAAVAAVLEGGVERHHARLLRELRATARSSHEPGWPGLGADDVARLAVALSDIAVRDDLWLAADAGRVDGRPLWREIARRAPGPYRAAPLLLFGWLTWRAGDGALAGIAAQRAVECDPGCTAADLLQAAVSHCVDPRTMPPLRHARRAAAVSVSRRRGRRRGR